MPDNGTGMNGENAVSITCKGRYRERMRGKHPTGVCKCNRSTDFTAYWELSGAKLQAN